MINAAKLLTLALLALAVTTGLTGSALAQFPCSQSGCTGSTLLPGGSPSMCDNPRCPGKGSIRPSSPRPKPKQPSGGSGPDSGTAIVLHREEVSISGRASSRWEASLKFVKRLRSLYPQYKNQLINITVAPSGEVVWHIGKENITKRMWSVVELVEGEKIERVPTLQGIYEIGGGIRAHLLQAGKKLTIKTRLPNGNDYSFAGEYQWFTTPSGDQIQVFYGAWTEKDALGKTATGLAYFQVFPYTGKVFTETWSNLNNRRYMELNVATDSSGNPIGGAGL